MKLATKVIIDGKEFKVENLLTSGSRGDEYLLSSDTQENCRVCVAKEPGTVCRTSGEHLEFR